ncbi:glucan biosynthesis protein [Pseudoroseicyclus aestuarii]|uniref:Glucans biosynthesis protein n=1 Tax=Pseudoroseicyclus aestuarii TaxID=1795041 RepID=A0A318SXQ7_9RHOB|nr:glucan biosynthesis protein G [Pseudoroseicyclus aestuarii]PYE86152.1 glucans biosynthesis protein [Pseudoroseicyclus aestuarii]
MPRSYKPLPVAGRGTPHDAAVSRRRLLQVAVAAGLTARAGWPAAALAQEQAAPTEGRLAQEAQPFSFDALSEEMRLLAQEPYREPETPGDFPRPDSYDAYRRIRFRQEAARWATPEPEDAGARAETPHEMIPPGREDSDQWRPIDSFQLHAFPLGWLFEEPVRLYEVEGDQAREMLFSTADFDYDDMEAEVADDAVLPGIAGFRINAPLNRPDKMDELIAFLGASYFRALGRGSVYGASARGVAIDTATSRAEEFPRFTRFWLQRPTGDGPLVIHAALDGPSLAGAFRFTVDPGEETVMDVTARLYPREDIGQLGIAPLTSMFLFSEKNRAEFDDYRDAVHDSDGLRIVRASGDVVWRPLNNPPRLAGSYLSETSPVSFGLCQRDRDFDNYQDLGARYEKRPSLIVEPEGDWGQGIVRLVEIPTDLEANDNIVAFWIPEQEARAGDSLEFRYRLHWGNLSQDEPTELARVGETRAGAGGVSGVEAQENSRKFVIDFEGGLLGGMPADAAVELVHSSHGGEVTVATLDRLEGRDIWRAVLDVTAEDGGLVELSAHIAGYGRKLTEIWVCQWINA